MLALIGCAVLNAKLTLSWTDNSAAETGFSVERATENKAFVEIAVVDANKVSYEDRDVQAGIVYTYRIRAFNQFGYSSYSNAVSKKLPVTEVPESDPATNPEKTGDPSGNLVPSTLIGAHKNKGYYDYLDDIGTHLLGGSGKGLRWKSDSLRFAYSSAEQDSQVTILVSAISTSSSKAEASLIFRQGLSAKSRYVAVSLDQNFNASASWRTGYGKSVGRTKASESFSASYLRIKSNSREHTLEASANGFDWRTLSVKNCLLKYPYLVGFGISSWDNNGISYAAYEILESNVDLLEPSYSMYGPSPAVECTARQDIKSFYSYEEDIRLHSLGAGGKGIEPVHDELVFPNWKGQGRVRIAARIENFQPDGDWARFGLAIRSGKNSNAAFAAIGINGMNQIEALWRTEKGSKKAGKRYGTFNVGTYVAVEFDGDTVSLQYSKDGANWTVYAEKTIQLGSTYRIGPFIGSQNGYSTGSLQVIGLY